MKKPAQVTDVVKWLLTPPFPSRSSLPPTRLPSEASGSASAVGFLAPLTFAFDLHESSGKALGPCLLPHLPARLPSPQVIFWNAAGLLMEVFVCICHPVTCECSLLLGNLPRALALRPVRAAA